MKKVSENWCIAFLKIINNPSKEIMTVTVILSSIDFYDRISPFSP